MTSLLNDKDTYRVMKLFISPIIINNNLAKKLFRYQKHFQSYHLNQIIFENFVQNSENRVFH